VTESCIFLQISADFIANFDVFGEFLQIAGDIGAHRWLMVFHVKQSQSKAAHSASAAR
jgi:hypothetical protein